ncbi:MAG: hypothetical protein E8D45_10025 [Nitrospira sp.]|nr:MAG: hypothetical protein E8D45_10025 [Nitrospira sp.]
MSEGVAQDPRMPTHPAQSWGVSILGHGVALWVALFVLGDLTFVPKEEPFRWDVSMVEPPPQPTAEPVPTLAEPVSVTAPQTPATSATEVVQTVQPFQRVETREVQRDIPQTRPVEQAVERTVSQPVTRPVETVVQAGPAAAKATPSPVIEATAIETASASVREVVRPNTTATVAPAPVVTTPQREAVAQASRAMASPAPLVRTSQPESVVQAGQALAKAAPTPVVESKAIETASAREVVASKVVSAPPAGPIDAPSQPAQEATVRQVPMRRPLDGLTSGLGS